ncbi:MAG: hypothetical protein ACREI2_04010 [Nitrospiraceae bacterium]
MGRPALLRRFASTALSLPSARLRNSLHSARCETQLRTVLAVRLQRTASGRRVRSPSLRAIRDAGLPIPLVK